MEEKMTTKEIIDILLEKAKLNNDCINSEDITEYVDIDSLEFDEIEEALEDDGVIINFSKEEDEISKVEEVKIETYDELIRDFNATDSVKQYLREIGNIPLLTKEEELKYTKMVHEGKIAKRQLEKIENDDQNTVSFNVYQSLLDKVEEYEKIKEKLINSNLRLVVSVAKKYAAINTSMYLLDLIQEGNMGLIKAIDKFDYRKGFKFSTYATWWIRQSITRAIGDQARTIRIPIHVVESRNRYLKAKRTLIQEYGREATYEELAEYLGISLKKVQELENYGHDLISLDTTINDDKDSTLEDIIPDKNSISPEKYTMKNKLSDELNNCLSKLTPREEKVIRLRFGLDDGVPKTLEEVGKVFDVTRERIRQIEAKALRKLKRPTYSAGLKEFIEYI